MDKKKLTGEELRVFLLGLGGGFLVGGLVANCAEVLCIGGFFCADVCAWSAFKEVPQTKKPPNRPL